ncbi:MULTISPECIES: head maturation protease, ClpP-related [Staphylococcus]|uniref:head maturation protease, ClpP-related n=1 Tax=Staphylococcus TaxID=1279 RepID=UPI00091E85D3|nr:MULTISPECIES: head maturation protease, ClpP-related [Staphylococcus]MBE2133570.1 Clp protease ClpP [Staphylococcus argenteus]MBE2146324.1 Clp protease ClpP [Staphylococcus argenteus]MBE2161634.1 Clp protease ClpP [Staphylococcus argenteus]MCG9800277.1 Clp protease ClpP [Staphylococcus argenteus]MCG9802471.1 Clp protease ClpP [Staphylococcus argenteus]
MKINVKGAIIPNNDKWIYEMLEMDATSPKDIADSLPDTNEDIDIIINSGGGDVYSGSEIYTSLKEYPGKVNIKIVGVAASAASVIAMAGDHIEMSPTAQMMIHNAWTMAMGDTNEMQKAVDMLDSVNKGIANAYINKTGKTEDEILSLMNKETWFNAQDAVEHGFADSKMFDEAARRLVANSGQMLSDDVINRVTALVSKTPEMKIDIDAIANKVIEKMNITNEKPKNTINESGFNRFLF